ncbi:MAG TPA: sulfatase-like hydrolase/transferase, partial [Lacipirellula sp.]
VNNKLEHFADNVAYMDKLVGRVAAKLDELGIRDNTIVMFLGDNGTGRRIVSQFQGKAYPGGKGDTSARGTHVPLIVSWPGKIAGGSVNRDLISSTDFLPTMCAAAGVEPPTSAARDGQSFLPQLLGEQGAPRRWHYSWYGRGDGLETVHESVMTKDYKLYRDGRFFDLTSDPYEEIPRPVGELTGKEADAAAELSRVLEQFSEARPAEVAAAAEAAAEEAKERPRRQGRRRGRRRQSASHDAAAAGSIELPAPGPQLPTGAA